MYRAISVIMLSRESCAGSTSKLPETACDPMPVTPESLVHRLAVADINREERGKENP